MKNPNPSFALLEQKRKKKSKNQKSKKEKRKEQKNKKNKLKNKSYKKPIVIKKAQELKKYQ